MLLELKVKNLGIIEDITWRLGNGLNIITGETGAGKSLIIDAVELLLSGKASDESIRYGASEARIEGFFDLPQRDTLSPLRQSLAENDLNNGEDVLIISCHLRRNGTGVVRVNGHAVSRSLLRRIGRLLVDVHGQSEHLSLLDSKSHLDYLDLYAHTVNLRTDFHETVSELRKIEQELRTLAQDERDIARREEFLGFQLSEISQAKLRDGEEEALIRELNILSSTEKLKELSYLVYGALYEEDGSEHSTPALDSLNKALKAMKKLSEMDPELSPQLKFLGDTVNALSEVARDIRNYGESLQYDPVRLQDIESRLDLIKRLKRKYGQTIAEVLKYEAKVADELEDISNHSENCSELERKRARLKHELGEKACMLSRERSKAAKQLIIDVQAEFRDLNMPQVQFGAAIKQQPAEDGITFESGTNCAFNETGADTVEFMVSTNPGEPLKPLTRIASTGELSRFTLALKSALAEVDNIPILIFDEIDIGIGGRSGEVTGQKLWNLGRHHQVICITHLPQIAAFADEHYCVRKVATGDRTLSLLEKLDEETRLNELAAMLSGSRLTVSSLDNAGDIIQKANSWKTDALS